MAQGDKSAYYQALKRAGYKFARHYREYTTDELREAWEALCEKKGTDPDLGVGVPKAKPSDIAELGARLDQLTGVVAKLAEMVSPEQRRAEKAAEPVAAAARKVGTGAPKPMPASHKLDPAEHAGVTLNTHTDLDVIKIDEYGNKWLQIEVPKPAYPKPRGRRVLRYMDPGVREEQIKVGEYVETFEVAGDAKSAKPAEIKVTLPSYQTGIYLSPEFPFRIHTYNGARGFNMADVHAYYGGKDLVPSTIKRTYVSNDLCYDIQSVVRTIENEYRERVLRAEKGLHE